LALKHAKSMQKNSARRLLQDSMQFSIYKGGIDKNHTSAPAAVKRKFNISKTRLRHIKAVAAASEKKRVNK
jgi:hypothetical protein